MEIYIKKRDVAIPFYLGFPLWNFRLLKHNDIASFI